MVSVVVITLKIIIKLPSLSIFRHLEIGWADNQLGHYFENHEGHQFDHYLFLFNNHLFLYRHLKISWIAKLVIILKMTEAFMVLEKETR